MKEKVMTVTIIFLLLVIALDTYVLIKNNKKEVEKEPEVNNTLLLEELNQVKEDNKDKIERYEEVESWNKEIIEYLK